MDRSIRWAIGIKGSGLEASTSGDRANKEMPMPVLVSKITLDYRYRSSHHGDFFRSRQFLSNRVWINSKSVEAILLTPLQCVAGAAGS